MKDIIAVKTDTGLDVSHATGGRNSQSPGVSRSRHHIVSEMRHAVGLPPLPVPLGLPLDVAPQAPPPPSAEAATGADAPTAASPAVPHLPSDLSLALEFVSLRRQADGDGGLVHAYTFRDGYSELRATCPAAGPRDVPRAPVGAILLGTSGAITYWVVPETAALVSTTRMAVSAAPGDVDAPKGTSVAAVIGAPAPSSFVLHAAVALLAIIAVLLIVVVTTVSPVVGGHAALPSPFPDPGARDMLRAGYALSLRTLVALLARALLAGYTVAAAGAHACAACMGGICTAAVAVASALAAPAAALARIALVATAAPVGAVTSVCTAAALSGAACLAAAVCLRRALRLLRHSCIGGADHVRSWLSTLIPGRLTGSTGRVFPLIPPTGRHLRRERHPRRAERLLSRPQWQSRFALLFSVCRSDLVGQSPGPVKLLLATQLALVACLDVGARLLNLRTTAAGHPAEATTVLQSWKAWITGGRTVGRAVVAAIRNDLRSLLRTAWLLSLLFVSAAVRFLSAALATLHDSESWHRRSCAATDALDALAGRLTPRLFWIAALHTISLPDITTDLVTRTRSLVTRCMHVILITIVLAGLRLRRAAKHAMGKGKLVLTIALVIGELALWHRSSPFRPSAAVAPLPYGARGPLSPTVSAAVAALQRPEHVVPHAACSVRSHDTLELSTAPPPRRIGFALRKSALVLPPKTRLPSAKGAWRSAHPVHRWARLVIDSGCTWHVHNRLDELSNVRDCDDVVVDANGNEVECAKMGDLLVVVQDSRKREFRVWLRGVRYSPSFEDTLVSVDQLWFASRIDSVFRDVRALVCLQNTDAASGEPLQLPFSRDGGLYRWTVGVVKGTNAPSMEPPPATGNALGLKSGIHSAGSRSHVHALPADDAAAVLHRRLHVSLDHLRRLSDHSADAPEHVAAARHLTCPICAEANSTRLPHGHSQYQPTHAGRLVHADIVGPFV